MNEKQENFIAKFYSWHNMCKQDAFVWIKQQRELIKQFNTIFTIDFIKNMTLEQYAIGQKNTNTFCYWIDQKISIEEVKGRMGAAALYGIYWDKKSNSYCFLRTNSTKSKFGSNVEEVFNNIKEEIISLILCVKKNDIQGIANNKLSPPFKGKLAFLYNWQNTVAIHSNDHLYALLTYLGIKTYLKEFDKNNPYENRFLKRQKLFNFIKSLHIPELDSVVLDSFLYDKDGDGFRNILYSKESSRYFENIQKVLCVEAKNVSPIIRTQWNKQKHGKIQLQIENELQKGITGEIAEQHVFDYLNKNKKDFNIVGDIVWESQTNDYAHYDIGYLTANNQKMFIEVKSSSSDLGNNVTFFMSDAEYNFMLAHKDNYKLFFVNNVSSCPKIIIFNPDQIVVKPIKYISELNYNG